MIIGLLLKNLKMMADDYLFLSEQFLSLVVSPMVSQSLFNHNVLKPIPLIASSVLKLASMILFKCPTQQIRLCFWIVQVRFSQNVDCSICCFTFSTSYIPSILGHFLWQQFYYCSGLDNFLLPRNETGWMQNYFASIFADICVHEADFVHCSQYQFYQSAKKRQQAVNSVHSVSRVKLSRIVFGLELDGLSQEVFTTILPHSINSELCCLLSRITRIRRFLWFIGSIFTKN